MNLDIFIALEPNKDLQQLQKFLNQILIFNIDFKGHSSKKSTNNNTLVRFHLASKFSQHSNVVTWAFWR